MKRIVVLQCLALLLLATSSNAQKAIKCPEFYIDALDEVSIISKFDEHLKSDNEVMIDPSCPEHLMRIGFYNAAEWLLENWFVPKKIDIVDSIRSTADYLKREMDKRLRIAQNFNQKQTIVPVLKWGQNYTHVLIYVKYAHRFDSPGCLDVWGRNLTLNKSHLNFRALGIQTDSPLEFVLDFPLFKNIISKKSYYKSESVGTMVIHLKKKKKKIWRHLVPLNFPKNHLRIKVWWELADIYKRAMKDFNRLIDEEEDRKEEVFFNAINLGKMDI